ncbi:NAD-dependent epimerase/dehydratase family protein [Paenibacillus mesotrionivorans]|uniref:NAD-dependent epimerase/dehydratase family protein n=1 Tax=Paenibacillus mesotrionivorans TaxID=3160968 RepID=A0ACC7NWY9_9BACL
MSKALIGYTGYVGSSLMDQTYFDSTFNSKNIEQISGKEFDLLICAGAPAVKWKANQDPDEDWQNLNRLMNNLRKVYCKKLVLISTVDVYPVPVKVNEDSKIIPEENTPYGKHRFYLEQFTKSNFSDVSIVRLPGLFGKGLKKNFIYDMIHNNCLDLQHKDSQFQFYDLKNLWRDIELSLSQDIKLINFSCEPVTASEISQKCFGVPFNNIPHNNPAYYDMKSKYASLFNKSKEYMYTKEEVLHQIIDFIEAERVKN